MRTVILHYHLFKNAGTSLDQVLKDNFDDTWVTREFPNASRPEGNTPQVEAWIRNTPKAVAFSSHTMMGPIPKVEGVRIITIMLLRDPIDRIKSAYRFERKQQAETFGAVLARHTDLEGYVKVRLSVPQDRQCRNFQTARLASMFPGPEPELERALRGLEALDVAGLVEDFSGTLTRLAEVLSESHPDFFWEEVHSNKSRKTGGETDAITALLEEINADDLALLDHCRKMLPPVTQG